VGAVYAQIDIAGVLVFAEQRKMEKDSQRTGIGSEDDDFGDTTVERFCDFVGTV